LEATVLFTCSNVCICYNFLLFILLSFEISVFYKLVHEYLLGASLKNGYIISIVLTLEVSEDYLKNNSKKTRILIKR